MKSNEALANTRQLEKEKAARAERRAAARQAREAKKSALEVCSGVVGDWGLGTGGGKRKVLLWLLAAAASSKCVLVSVLGSSRHPRGVLENPRTPRGHCSRMLMLSRPQDVRDAQDPQGDAQESEDDSQDQGQDHAPPPGT